MKTNKLTNQKILILGGGMAGLGASATLKKLGFNSTLLEMEDRPGGLFSNLTVGDCDFDYGPKILLLDDSDNSKEILSYLGDNYEKFPVKEGVYHSKYGLMHFPLQRHLIDLPLSERRKILKDLKYVIDNPQEVLNFKDWLISKYGRYFAEMILIPYEEKKWQISLEEMDYRWALKRPVKVDLNEVIKGSKEVLPTNRWYYYPKRGNISSLTTAISKKSGEILYNQKVTRIDLDKKIVISNNKIFHYDVLISSLPLDYVVDITDFVPNDLKQRADSVLKRLSVYIFNFVYEGDFKLDGTAIYFPEKDFIFRRVSVLQNLCPALKKSGKTSISVEVSVNHNQENIDVDQVYKKVLEDLGKIDQFAKLGKPVDYKLVTANFAYPLQLRGLSYCVADLHRYFRDFNVYHCGRGGNYDYCNGDEAYKQGADIARNVIRKLEQEAPGNKKELTFTVGIPSYKSGPSIVSAVHSLRQSQGVNEFRIIILVDGPMDENIKNQLVSLDAEVIHNKERQGQTAANKKIAALTDTDILIMTQDDVVFETNTLKQIIDGFSNDLNVTMIAPRLNPLPPKVYFEQILHSGVNIARRISQKWRDGDNYLSSIGRCLAFQTEMIKRFEIDDKVVNCDAYYYFENKRLSGKYKYLDNAIVYYRPPQNLNEHLMQVRKFVVSEKEMNSYLKMDLNTEYKLPTKIFLAETFSELLSKPVLTALYLGISFYARTRPKSFYQEVTNKWDIDTSTKDLS